MDLRLYRGLSVAGQTFRLLLMLSEALGFMWPLQGNGLNGITCTHNGVESGPNGPLCCLSKEIQVEGNCCGQVNACGVVVEVKVWGCVFSFCIILHIFPLHI